MIKSIDTTLQVLNPISSKLILYSVTLMEDFDVLLLDHLSILVSEDPL